MCRIITLIILILSGPTQAQVRFTIRMPRAEQHQFQVTMTLTAPAHLLDVTMPTWTPGYYQFLHFAKNVSGFAATASTSGQAVPWTQINEHTWRIATQPGQLLAINYTVTTLRPFVAQPYVDTARAYIVPTGVCLYPEGRLEEAVEITVDKPAAWPHIATGLAPVSGQQYTYRAENYDVLYDSPLLVGRLTQLPSFEVRGVPHHFWAWNPGTFDQNAFIAELQKVVTAAVDLIGHIPYEQYVFIGIGPGRGGIEHLNSTTFSFNGQNLHQGEERLRMLFFLGHEYYHHYNVKRIRPLELGPFDYTRGSRTRSLWISEGLTVYYEYLIARRAGICSDEDLLMALQKNILAYEDKPGKQHQSLAEASYYTWSDGPFGRTEDEVNKTISYYDKGPVVGWLLDLAIRQATGNARSLDDVMRTLYTEYYQKQNRGFTEEEFKSLCTAVSGSNLGEIWDYVNTTRDLDYSKYLHYAGLTIDTQWQDVPGAWLGVTGAWRADSLRISQVEYSSPAWQAGLRRGQVILSVAGQKPVKEQPLLQLMAQKPGDRLSLSLWDGIQHRELTIVLGLKKARSFKITPQGIKDEQQEKVYQGWTKG